MQDDTNNLSDCVKGWLSLTTDDNISESVRGAIQLRFRKTVTVWHCLAYMADNRRKAEWPSLPDDIANQAREEVMEMGDSYIHSWAAYETEDTTCFPKVAFSAAVKAMSPQKYWAYVAKITADISGGKTFATMMAKIFVLPPSSAGIERIFSTAGLVQSKLRNRLSVEKVGRLVSVSRILSIADKTSGPGISDLEEGFTEDVTM